MTRSFVVLASSFLLTVLSGCAADAQDPPPETAVDMVQEPAQEGAVQKSAAELRQAEGAGDCIDSSPPGMICKLYEGRCVCIFT